MSMLLILWMCLCLSVKRADITQTSQSINYGNNGWSASLSNVVIMSAMTRAAIKRCLEFEPGLVFQSVETKVKIYFCRYFFY